MRGHGVISPCPLFYLSKGVIRVYKVKVKSKGYNGVRAGVHFSMGEATFEDEKLVKVFKRLGYEVTKLETKETQKDAEPIKKEVKKAPAKRKAPAKKKKEE